MVSRLRNLVITSPIYIRVGEIAKLYVIGASLCFAEMEDVGFTPFLQRILIFSSFCWLGSLLLEFIYRLTWDTYTLLEILYHRNMPLLRFAFLHMLTSLYYIEGMNSALQVFNTTILSSRR